MSQREKIKELIGLLGVSQHHAARILQCSARVLRTVNPPAWVELALEGLLSRADAAGERVGFETNGDVSWDQEYVGRLCDDGYLNLEEEVRTPLMAFQILAGLTSAVENRDEWVMRGDGGIDSRVAKLAEHGESNAD